MKKRSIGVIAHVLLSSNTLSSISSISQEEIEKIKKELDFKVEKLDEVEYFENSSPKKYGMQLQEKKKKRKR